MLSSTIHEDNFGLARPLLDRSLANFSDAPKTIGGPSIFRKNSMVRENPIICRFSFICIMCWIVVVPLICPVANNPINTHFAAFRNRLPIQIPIDPENLWSSLR
jgi:hypothetical protein